MGPISVQADDPARAQILSELRHRAVEVFGEARVAESTLQAALESAAAAVWQVTVEPLEPSAEEP